MIPHYVNIWVSSVIASSVLATRSIPDAVTRGASSLNFCIYTVNYLEIVLLNSSVLKNLVPDPCAVKSKFNSVSQSSARLSPIATKAQPQILSPTLPLGPDIEFATVLRCNSKTEDTLFV